MAGKLDIDIGRLAAAMQRSRLVLKRYREERREAVRQYVGSHWSDEGTSQKVPLNLIALYINVVGRNLIAKNPRVMLATFNRPNKPAVNAMESWANNEIEKLQLGNTLQRVVLDALFSVGIAKVALATPADASLYNWNLPAGAPFCARVDLDDFVYDIHARDFSEASFIGHRYRVPLDVVKDSKLYSKARKDLGPSHDQPYNREGDQRINVLGRTLYGGDTEEFEDFVDLWEVYLPRHRVVLTLADDDLIGGAALGAGGTGEALREQPWIGPESGPYHLLAYGVVPGNAMPKGPIQDLIDLHEIVNSLYRKIGRQGERQKEVLLVAGGAMEDANRIQQCSDGDIIRCDRPDLARPAMFGGPNQQNLALAVHLKDIFAYMAGNLDMMGGLSPQSKTLGQDKMLAENASRAVADMQARTIEHAASVLKAMCWYWWHDPMRVMRVNHSLPGLADIQIQRQVPPEKRTGKFEDLEIRIDPYSMQHATPQSRLMAINQVVQQVIAPMMGLLAQQGVAFDINAYLTKISKYLDMPDLAEIITIQEPPAEESTGSSDGAAMPAQTERTYTRRSLGGDTPENREATMLNSVQGNGQQNRNGQLQPAQ